MLLMQCVDNILVLFDTRKATGEKNEEMNLFLRNLDFKPSKKKILLISWA